jgi:hypothetical protein
MLYITGRLASIALFILLALACPSDCVCAGPAKTAVKVIDPGSKPARSAKIRIYSKDDMLIAEGITNSEGDFFCPEIDPAHESVLIVATRGSLYGNKMMRTESREWPSEISVKLRERRI